MMNPNRGFINAAALTFPFYKDNLKKTKSTHVYVQCPSELVWRLKQTTKILPFNMTYNIIGKTKYTTQYKFLNQKSITDAK